MSNICHNGRVVYLRQSSATLFARCKSRVLSTISTARQVALLCPPMFVCTPSSAQERIIVQNVHGWIAHYCIALCAQVLCVVGVDTRTSFAFRCLCHLKSTTPILNSPERGCAKVKMIWIQENSLLVFSFQIYIWHNSVKITTAVTGFWVYAFLSVYPGLQQLGFTWSPSFGILAWC